MRAGNHLNRRARDAPVGCAPCTCVADGCALAAADSSAVPAGDLASHRDSSARGERPDGALEVRWTLVLEEHAPGATRLLVRVRSGRGYRLWGLPLVLTRIVARAVHFIVQRSRTRGSLFRAKRMPQAGREWPMAF